MEWQGYDQSQNGWVSWESLMQVVPTLVWAFERNPSNFTPRSSVPKRASVVPRSVSVVPTEANLVASSVVGTAGGGYIVMVHPENKGSLQRPKSVVVSDRRSHTGGARIGLRSQMH